MQVNAATSVDQLHLALSDFFGCRPSRLGDRLIWTPARNRVIAMAILHEPQNGLLELEVTLGCASPTTTIEVHALWARLAAISEQSGKAAVPITPDQDGDGGYRIAARLTLQDKPFDLPRREALGRTLAALEEAAAAIRLREERAARPAPAKVPPHLAGVLRPIAARPHHDSGSSDDAKAICGHLARGMAVAMIGSPARVKLELNRLARVAPNIAVLLHQVPLQKLPEIAAAAKDAGFILAAHCSSLVPRMSLYELGGEVDGALQRLEADALPFLAWGTRDELDAIFAVGQGRHLSPLRPVVHTLSRAEDADIIRALLAERRPGLADDAAARIVSLVLGAMKHHPGKEALLQPLTNLAADREPADTRLPRDLDDLAADLAGRRDTFGVLAETPATPRPDDLRKHLVESLRGTQLEEMLQAELFGQANAIDGLARRLWQEAVSRPAAEPMRLLLAGPSGSGKSLAAKLVAKALGFPYHYVDSASFDSPHAVMTSLAGASRGIVNSYEDGILAQISRRPAVVEVADIDHAQAGVRGALVDFFLRVLQEGTLQTGSGRIVTTIPSVLFIFTSNSAFGPRTPNSPLGFVGKSGRQLREAVIAEIIADLGHAFFSRVGQPIVFGEFTTATAVEVARHEIDRLVRQALGVDRVAQASSVAEAVVGSLAGLEGGARRIIDETREQLCHALRTFDAAGAREVAVRYDAGQIVIDRCE